MGHFLDFGRDKVTEYSLIFTRIKINIMSKDFQQWKLWNVLSINEINIFACVAFLFFCIAADESMKDMSEPTGSPAPVIQHSSLAPSPSTGQNGLSSRAAAEAMAMSVLAGMGQQQRAESGPSHIIMAAQSQSAARWWAMPPRPTLGSSPRVEKTPTSQVPSFLNSEFHIFSSAPPPLCGLSNPPGEPSCWGLELISSLLGKDWDF